MAVFEDAQVGLSDGLEEFRRRGDIWLANIEVIDLHTPRFGGLGKGDQFADW